MDSSSQMVLAADILLALEGTRLRCPKHHCAFDIQRDECGEVGDRLLRRMGGTRQCRTARLPENQARCFSRQPDGAPRLCGSSAGFGCQCEKTAKSEQMTVQPFAPTQCQSWFGVIVRQLHLVALWLSVVRRQRHCLLPCFITPAGSKIDYLAT